MIPNLRVVAQEVLGADSPIDFVCADPAGRVALVLVGEEGQDLELVARGLAQRAWLEPRLRDWLQLAPTLGLRPEAGVQLVLLCPGFRREAEAAGRALGDAAPTLAIYRCIRNGAGVDTLLERLSGSPAPIATSRPPPQPATEAPLDPVAGFRTGLTDAELGLSPSERLDLESRGSPAGGQK